jgi:hypothetical protein
MYLGRFSDGEAKETRLEHDDPGLNQSISIPMFRSIGIGVMNVIFSKNLARMRA